MKDLCEKVLVHPVFLCPVVGWKRIGPAHDLIKISEQQQQNPPLHLENCLPEVIVGIFAFSETLEAEIAEVRKVDQTFPVMKNIMVVFDHGVDNDTV